MSVSEESEGLDFSNFGLSGHSACPSVRWLSKFAERRISSQIRRHDVADGRFLFGGNEQPNRAAVSR